MVALFVIAVVIVLLFLAYILAIKPNTKRGEQMSPFEKQYIAHRGFFNNIDVPENSMTAFALAVNRGYGIELDVQLTTDNQLVVFHDTDLDRMCKEQGRLFERSYSELCSYSLLDTDEKIPLLKDVLKLVNGRVPLIIEIKSDGRYIDTAVEVSNLLSTYSGIYCLESFHPFVVRWFKRNRPGVVRGQLSTDYYKDDEKLIWYKKLVLANLLLNWLAKPDFVAYNHKHSNQVSFKLCQKIYKVKSVAWTIKSQEELEHSKDCFEIYIFDSFIPDHNA